MPIEHEIPRWSEWIGGAALQWGIVLLVVGLLSVGLTFLLAAVGRGPGVALRIVGGRLLEATKDLIAISPGRVGALSMLAMREAVRRRVLYAGFGLYAVILLFGAWFLTPSTQDPAKVYLSFVLGWSSFLVLILAVFMSVFSLPTDISRHTIYTIVTKPVRPNEIVLGRIIGFSAVGTLLLVVMGFSSYFFVLRGLDHGHEVQTTSLHRVRQTSDRGDRTLFKGRTTSSYDHFHDVTIDIDAGLGSALDSNGHEHNVTLENTGDKSGSVEKIAAAGETGGEASPSSPEAIRVTSPEHGLRDGDLVRITGVEGAKEANSVWVVRRVDDNSFDLADSQYVSPYVSGGKWTTVQYVVGSPFGMLTARVPIYAKTLGFIDRDGAPAEKGVNVGNEWTYRSFIEGGTPSRAMWMFDGITPENFPRDQDQFKNGLPLQMTLRVFRTHKGDIKKRVLGAIYVRNPKTGLRSTPMNFVSDEYRVYQHTLPYALQAKDEQGRSIEKDFFHDFVDNGQVVIEVACVESAQYFGMAKPDLYILARDGSFAGNFAKGYTSIWLQMVLLTSLGVMFSTFLNGPVAMLATSAAAVGGVFSGFISNVISGELPGGGPFESLLRLVTKAPRPRRWIPA